jgi:hypothetical protein
MDIEISHAKIQDGSLQICTGSLKIIVEYCNFRNCIHEFWGNGSGMMERGMHPEGVIMAY